MHNLITIITLFFIPMLASAQMYFKDGTTWQTRITGTHQYDNIIWSNTYATIDGTENVDNYQAMKMFCYDDDNITHKLYGYIRTDGDKVYIKPVNSTEKQWFLMYDFSLGVGEGCYVYGAYNIDQNPDKHKSYIKCIGIGSEAESGLATMTIEEYYETESGEKQSLGTFKWYKGISSEMGVLYNVGLGLDGIGKQLMTVSNNDNIIYQRTTTSVSDMPDNRFSVTLNGRYVSLNNIESPCELSLFTADGKRICQFAVKGKSTELYLPESGVYILKVGKQTKKLVVCR